jgi:hypothetical protein
MGGEELEGQDASGRGENSPRPLLMPHEKERERIKTSIFTRVMPACASMLLHRLPVSIQERLEWLERLEFKKIS